MARLENLGLYDELYKIGRECGNDPKIVHQLRNFQQNTGQVLGGLQFENEVHKERCRLLTKQTETLEKKMQIFNEQ